MSILHAAAGLEIELEIFPLGTPEGNLVHAFGYDAQALCGRFRGAHGNGELREPDGPPDVVIVHTLPTSTVDVLKHLKLDKYRDECPALIVYTTWEADSLPPPDILAMWGLFDQLWMPSWTSWKHPTIPTHVVPHSFDEEDTLPMRKRSSDVYRFYYVGAWDVRKQPGALIRAFASAFRPGDPVELVMHVLDFDVHNFATQLATTGLAQHDLPSIYLSNKYKTDEEISQFHADGDCYVSATRWEAWNLPAFDAMLAAKPMIVPADMGHRDFLKATSAIQYPTARTPCAADVRAEATERGFSLTVHKPQGVSSRCWYREPDIAELADWMVQYAREKHTILHGAKYAREKFTRHAVGKKISQILENL